MKLQIRRKLSQISFLAVTALSLSAAGNAVAAENMSEIDSNAVSQEELYAPGVLDELFVEQQLATEYAPLDGFAALDDHRRGRRGDRDRRDRWDGDRDRDNRWGRGERGRRGRGRTEVVACYARDWRGQAYVAYNENFNARRAQRQAVRYCEQVTNFRCQALGCRREWH